MKKLFFMAVLLVLSLSAAPQDYYYDNNNSEYEDDINPDDYVYDIDDGVDLTGEQWHTNDASILAANNSQYIVVRGPTRYRYVLGSLNIPAYERVWGYRISDYRPYYYNGSLGWYVLAGLINYFIYPDGRWCRLSYEPYYYPYRYHIAHCHRINFFDWHFWHGRHHHSYRGTCYYNHRHGSSYGSHYYRRSKAPNRHNDYRNSSYRSTNRGSSGTRSERVNSIRSNSYRQTSSRQGSGYTKAPDYRKGPDSGTYRHSQASGSRNSGSNYSRTSNSSRSSSYNRPSGSSSRNSYSRSSSGSSRSSYSRSSASPQRSSGTSSRSSAGSSRGSHRR